ncbi:TPA: NupC/NupG family nucleoside CNT transporter [Pasteurella multocida]|nr:NupC/NupG family nucleoside CNT transporter [Pasteurella multocida]
MSTLISILGIVVLLGIAFLLSNNHKAINFRTVLGALAIQIGIGALILYVPVGRDALLWLSEGISKVIAYGNEGISFLFGGLVSDKMFEVFGGGGFVFALRVLPIIVFFSALISVLYYIGIMQWIIKIIGGGLQKLLGTSKAESMSAAANIFVGQTEAPLIVKPYISKMTESELFAIMCGGLASIAGSVMAGYAGMGVPLPYLIAASFMAAPAGLLFAKILYPQTEKFNDNLEKVDLEKPANILDAAAGGASSGMNLALNVGAMLIAFVALIALINGILGGIGGYLDFTAYLKAAAADANMVQLTDKTQAIITFALCGFANFSSIAILIGGLGALAPNRRGDIARLGIRAVIAGSLANLMSATIAGLFIGLGGVAL